MPHQLDQRKAILLKKLPLMHEFPHLKGPQFEAPSTPYALCLWLRGDQRGELIALTAKLTNLLAPVSNSRTHRWLLRRPDCVAVLLGR